MSILDDKMARIRKGLKQANNEFSKRYGEERDTIFVAGDDIDRITPKYVSTGVPELDKSLGGGVAKGTALVIHGSPGAGKSSLGLSIIAQVQKADPLAFGLYILTEPPFPKVQAKLVGVDLSRLVVMSPEDYAEQIVDIMEALLFDNDKAKPKDDFQIVVIDSLSNLYTKAERDKFVKDGSEGTAQMAAQATLITNAYKRVLGRGMLRDGKIMVAIAQERANLSLYGAPTKMAGPWSVKYNSKVQIGLRKGESIKSQDLEIGHKVPYVVEKNNVDCFLDRGEYSIVYGIGLDDSADVVNKALEFKFIVKEGRSTYRVITPTGDFLFNSIKTLRDEFKANLELKNEMKALLEKADPENPPESTGAIRELTPSTEEGSEE